MERLRGEPVGFPARRQAGKALDLMIERDMPMNRWRELPTRSESFEILPFGPPCATWGRWAKISPLSTRLWITLEQALSFQ